MHTAGKVLLIIGGVITALGIVLIVGGAATANLDPSNENYYAGNGGDTWIVPGDDFYAVYTSSSVNCESFDMTITNPSSDYPDDNLFTSSCDYNNEDDLIDDDYIKVGDIEWFSTNEGDTLNFGQTSTTIYVVGEWEAVGDAAGGFLAAAGGVLIAICGGVILLIGLILALTLKTKDPVMMQQGQMMGGQMMAGQMPMQQMPAQQMPMQQMPAQQMPAQQMPAQTTAQPYEYEQK